MEDADTQPLPKNIFALDAAQKKIREQKERNHTKQNRWRLQKQTASKISYTH